MSGWAVEHGYVADGVETVFTRSSPVPGAPRNGFYDQRTSPGEKDIALGITECFVRCVPVPAADAETRAPDRTIRNEEESNG